MAKKKKKNDKFFDKLLDTGDVGRRADTSVSMVEGMLSGKAIKTSEFRGPFHNQVVDGIEGSAHTEGVGRAVDIASKPLTDDDLGLVKAAARIQGLGTHDSPENLHIDSNLRGDEGIPGLGQRPFTEDEQDVNNFALAQQDALAKGMGARLSKNGDGLTSDALLKSDLTPKEKGEAFVQSKDPVEVARIIESNKQVVNKGGEPSVKDAFIEALTFFLPTALGALVGGVIEGDEGVIAGAEAGGSLGASFRDFQFKQAEFKLKEAELEEGDQAVAKHQQTDFVDREGQPISFNPETNQFIKADGSVAQQGEFIDPVTSRQANSLEIRKSQLSLNDLKLRHKIAKDAQLSDKQVEKFTLMDTVLDSLDRIEVIKKEVATGLGRDKFQSMAEMADLAPKKFTELRAETASALANYVNSISGKQVTEAEAQRLKKLIPTVEDGGDVFEVKLKAFRRIVAANQRTFKRIIMNLQPLRAGNLSGIDDAERRLSAFLASPKGKRAAARKAKSSVPTDKELEGLSLEELNEYNRSN